MKNNYFKFRKNPKQQLFVLFVLFLGSPIVFAQVQNNGSVYIGDYGEMHIAGGVYAFGGAPATTKTTRSASNYGVLSFASGVVAGNASANHYADGYVKTYSNAFFLAPTGDGGVYAPAGVIGSDNSGVAVSYKRASPLGIGTALDSQISAISNSEYWIINGSGSATISLTWRISSAAHLLSASLGDLRILGFDSNLNKWVEIDSQYDSTSILDAPSTIAEGSLTSVAAVNLADYSSFTLGAKTCYPAVVASGNVKTWNGSWSPSAPGIADPVVIDAPYAGNLTCYSVALNADITLADAHVLEVVDGFTGTGKVLLSSEATLVQRNSGATAPMIEMTKITNPMRRFDYVFLSSPITSPTSFFAAILNKNNTAVNGEFGTRVNAAFETLRTYDAAGLAAINATAANTPVGRGFSATVRSQAPYSTSTVAESWYTEKYPIHIKTAGTANNGNVAISVPANGWARIGNPYPSAIDGEQLLNAAGPDMRKTLYYWTFNTPRQVLATATYSNADFATWNYSGGTAVCPTCEVPTGTIATMQSVLMKASNLSSNASTFALTNCMRVTTGNTNFYRQATGADKYWLNLTGTADSFSQILIAYNPEATYEYDNGLDSPRLSSTTSSVLSSLIGSDRYAIQTRPAFTSGDAVPLRVDKNIPEALTISLGNKQGIFAADALTVYVHDSALGIYHNLSESPYSFIQDQAVASDRFEIVYQDPTLSNPDVVQTKAMGLISNNALTIQASQAMDTVTIYDLAGRVVVAYNAAASHGLSKPYHHAQGVYIAKIKMVSGAVVNLKLVNH